jgi:hypothetical protein
MLFARGKGLMSAEIAAGNFSQWDNRSNSLPQRYLAGKNHVFCRPPKVSPRSISAAIAAGDFSQ